MIISLLFFFFFFFFQKIGIVKAQEKNKKKYFKMFAEIFTLSAKR